MTRSAPDVETLACAAAGGYAARWARGVARLRPDDAPDAPAPWLVDGYAGADLQRAALRGIPLTSPAAAFVRAADEAFGGQARIVLVEEDPGLLGRLEDALHSAGAGDRLLRASDPSGVVPGEIALVEASFASVAARLAGEIADAPALLRLAPLSARVLPWSTLELLADLSDADLLIRLPQEDFARAGKFPGPLADFPPHLRRVVEACSALLADARHGWLLAWREAMRAGGEDAALTATAERLRGMLGDGEQRTAGAARLEGAAGAVHLLVSTPHPDHALELNGAVMDAGTPPPAAPKPSRSKRAAGASPAAPAPPSAAPPPAERAPADPASAQPALTESAPAAPAPTDPAPAKPAPADSAPTESVPAESDATPAAAPSLPEPAPTRSDPDWSEAAPTQPNPDPPTPAPSPPQERVGEESPPPAATQTPAPRVAPHPIEPAAPEAQAPLLDLFALTDTPAPAAPELPRGPDLRVVADDLYARHAGRRVAYRELLGDLADAGLAPEQVRTALGLLKRDRRAAYRALDADGAEVEFLAEPAAPPPAPKPAKPRKAPKSIPGLLGLFDDPEAPADASAALPMDASDELPLMSKDALGAPGPEDDPPMSMADIIEPVVDDELPMTLADAIGGLESDAVDVPGAEAPADPPKKTKRRKGK